MRSQHLVAVSVLVVLGLCAGSVSAQSVTKETVAGVTNLARLETTVACAGAIKAEQAVPEIKKLKFLGQDKIKNQTLVVELTPATPK